MKNNVYFISGIDTDIGKSYATAYIAKVWKSAGLNVITQKLVQTGNDDMSEDIELHRRLLGMEMTEDDDNRTTMPEIFSYPCSPHLASEIDGRAIDFDKIEKCTEVLSEKYDAVLLEGAGGLMVPLTRDFLTIDYIAKYDYPVILTTSGRLGSINHTLLSLEALQHRGIKLHSLVYNMHPKVSDTTISDDTIGYLKDYLAKNFPKAEFIFLPCL